MEVAMKPIRMLLLLSMSTLALVGCHPPLKISTTTLPVAHPGKEYRETLSATGGSGERSWSLASGTLPRGLSLDSFSGDLAGYPVEEGSSTFTIKVTDEAAPQGVDTKTFTLAVEFSSDTEVVSGSSSSSIQAACDALKDTGGVVYLSDGDYIFTDKVTVYANTTIAGAGILENVCVQETSAWSDTPPVWSGRSRCYSVDPDLKLFETKGNGITFAHVKVEGASTNPHNGTYTGNGIHVTDSHRFKMVNCEVTGHVMGLVLRNSKKAVVEDSYFHHNLRKGLGYGICVFGKTMSQGGGRVVIRDCEFMMNRHGIASNSPDTWWAALRCYFHDNDPVTNQAAVDTHPHGGGTLRYFLADCTFENTRPTSFRDGFGSILRNKFQSSCGWWYSSMIKIGIPEHNGNHVNSTFHDSYIADNKNKSSRSLFATRSYNYSNTWWKPKRRVPVYSAFLGGKKFKNALWSPIKTNPRPVVGEVYLTKEGTKTRTHQVLSGKVYTVNAMLLDPQGRKNLESMTVYFAPMEYWDGSFSPKKSYSTTVDIAGKNVEAGWDSRTGDWRATPSDLSIVKKGNDRYHVKFDVVIPGDLDLSVAHRLVAFAWDKDNHCSLHYWDPYEITVR
jgi:hypothetical protein